MLVNAIYFDGDWALQFKQDRTKHEPFHLSADETVEVPMMQQTDMFRYAEFDELQLLELPYEGEELSMVVLLRHCPTGSILFMGRVANPR